MSGDEPTKTAIVARKKWATEVVINGCVIEVTPGDGVNPKSLAGWIAQNVEIPGGAGLMRVHVTSWYPRRWNDPEVKPHPAPVVPCRLAEPGEVPRGAKPVRAAAEAAGWAVVATYARGTRWTKSGPGTLVDSLALRMSYRRGERRAVAVWLNGRFDFGMRWAADMRPESVGVKELTAWMTS